jgi:hypothetical protein
MRFLGLDHIQLHVPAEKVDDAHTFYCLILGLQDLGLPQGRGGKGGFWMAVPECSIWVGPTEQFVTSKIVLEVDDLELAQCELEGCSIVPLQLPVVTGFERLEFSDPFGHTWQLVCRIPYDV